MQNMMGWGNKKKTLIQGGEPSVYHLTLLVVSFLASSLASSLALLHCPSLSHHPLVVSSRCWGCVWLYWGYCRGRLCHILT